MTPTIKSNPHIMEGLTILVVLVASVKFLFQGGSVHVFGSADASTYAMFLGPVLGTHGYIKTKKVVQPEENSDGKRKD